MLRLVAAFMVMAGLTACSSGEAPNLPPNPLTGTIRSIKGNRLVLRTEDGTYTFEIADPQVPIAHLRDVHIPQRLPVEISYDTIGTRLLARTIRDATPATAPG